MRMMYIICQSCSRDVNKGSRKNGKGIQCCPAMGGTREGEGSIS